MNMKLGEIRGNLQGLLNIAGKRFPAKVCYAISKNAKKLEKEYKELEEQRVKICESYADKDEDGKAMTQEKDGNKIYVFSDGNKKLCNKEYEELLEETIDIDIHTVDASEMDKCDGNERFDIPTGADYIAMEFMFK